MRGLLVPTRVEAAALKTRVDLAHGYPRCERLAGVVTVSRVAAGVPTTIRASDPGACPCTAAATPDPRCPFATHTQMPVIETRFGWAYPVREGKSTTMDALTVSEKAAITDIVDTDVRGVEAIAAAEAGR